MFDSIFEKYLRALFAVLIVASTAAASEKSSLSLKSTAEIGFLSVLKHEIQFGENASTIDYRTDAGQEILYPITRFSVDVAFNERHKAVLLYQPLRLESVETLSRDLVIDTALFQEGTPVKFTYSFPFYRVSWLYDFKEEPNKEIAAGISFQIRNAEILFETQDGKQVHTQRDVGPVPILKFRHRLPLGNQFWWGSEIDGFYAPVSYLNGSDEEVIGAILDASLRAGVVLGEKGESFLNLRYLGGGALGSNSEEAVNGSDGYVENWLHFLTVSLGFTLNIL